MLILAAFLAASLPAPPTSPVTEAPQGKVKEEILLVLRRLKPQIEACGKRAFGPTDATLFFTVDAKGVARDVGVDLNDAAAGCIIRLVANARFPAALKPQEVTVPLKVTRRPPTRPSDCASVDLDFPQPQAEVFDAAAILKRVKRILPAVRGCADKTSPARVRASWTVDTAGRPVDIVIDDSVGTAVGSCIAAQVATLRFPKPAKEEQVTLPFKLR